MNRILKFAAGTLLPLLFALPVSAQNVKVGEKIWKKCRACHAVGLDAKNKVGPQLNELFGRVAGSIEGARYSKAMIDAGAAGLVWNEDNLDLFLTRPKSFVKKTRMSFSGLKKPEDRANLIVFLKQFSGDTDGRVANLTTGDPDVPAEVLALKGDRDYGEYLSATCVGCHQLSGEDAGIPSIIGWPNEAFVTVMFSYRTKFRENQVMQQIAGSLNNEEIAALAAYFEELKAAE
jgi:cytochrome c